MSGSNKFVRHLIGEEPHLRKSPIGIPLIGIILSELLLGPLLVGVGPVEDLFLDELTGSQSLERRAGQIEIGTR